MNKLTSLTIFFPAYNDAHSIAHLASRAYDVGKKVSKKLEIIIINDGSTDNTAAVLKKLQKTQPRLKVIHHTKNLGYGAALREGFRRATNDWVFYTDGDGQYDPLELKRLARRAANNVDVVNGFKIARQDSVLRKFVGNLYNWLMHRLYRLPIRDIDCDFRLIRRTKLQNCALHASSGLICLELVTQLAIRGARFTEVGVSHYTRPFGRSQFFRFDHLIHTLQEHIRYYKIYRGFLEVQSHGHIPKEVNKNRRDNRSHIVKQ